MCKSARFFTEEGAKVPGSLLIWQLCLWMEVMSPKEAVAALKNNRTLVTLQHCFAYCERNWKCNHSNQNGAEKLFAFSWADLAYRQYSIMLYI